MTLSTRGISKSIYSPHMAAFCRLLVEARKKAGLTQQALALRLKRPQSFIAKYEGGERRLDVIEFVIIAQTIGADPVRLLALFLAGEKNRSKVRKIRSLGKKTGP